MFSANFAVGCCNRNNYIIHLKKLQKKKLRYLVLKGINNVTSKFLLVDSMFMCKNNLKQAGCMCSA